MVTRSSRIWGFALLFLLSACGSDGDAEFDPTEGARATGLGGVSDSGGPTEGDPSRGGGPATEGAGAPACGDTDCSAPATCDASDTTPRCVCPEGYEDTNGDGTDCQDIDECGIGADDCGAHSQCQNAEGGFDCICEDGYAAVSGGCLKENIGTCTDGAECASGNCVGGVCCAAACDSPGQCQALEGTICLNGDKCEYGSLADDTECGDLCATGACFEGECIITDSKDCGDENACTDDLCDPDTGRCSHPASDCDDNNPCTSDACNAGTGCVYTKDDAAWCSDGDDCTTDACSGGSCRSTPLNCTNLTDDCNEGICVAGKCEARPANQGGTCAQSLDACDANGKCNAAGACVGDDDACGPLATGCVPCTGSGACTQGRRCTCRAPTSAEPPIVVEPRAGMCQFDSDECSTDPCSPLATACSDPTPDGSSTGDYVCTCPAGYAGNGRGPNGCSDIDECQGANPCGAGVTASGCDGTSPPGGYSCTCSVGYRSILTPTGPTCVCDLAGSYAMLTTSTVRHDPVLVGSIEVSEGSGSGVEIHSWALRHHEVESDGSMTVTTIPCGGSAPTVCSTLNQTGLAQYQDSRIWGRSSMNDGFAPFKVPLAGVVPGGSYVEPETVVTSGIALARRDGDWPPCAACVNVPANQNTCTCSDGQHTITNRAFWVDSDRNGAGTGISAYAVLAGGASIGMGAHDPPFNYSADSECPRFRSGGPWPYAAWPGLAGGFFFTVAWDGASRTTSRVRSSTISRSAATADQCWIDGVITGPDSGQALTEARFRGCTKCASAQCDGQTTSPCNAAERDFYDTIEQSQAIDSASFQLRPLDSIDLGQILAMANETERAAALNAACQTVRETYCPAGETCAP